MAITIFGGLISATLLDSFLTPVLFLRFGREAIEKLRTLQTGKEQSAATEVTSAQAY